MITVTSLTYSLTVWFDTFDLVSIKSNIYQIEMNCNISQCVLSSVIIRDIILFSDMPSPFSTDAFSRKYAPHFRNYLSFLQYVCRLSEAVCEWLQRHQLYRLRANIHHDVVINLSGIYLERPFQGYFVQHVPGFHLPRYVRKKFRVHFTGGIPSYILI